MRPTLENAYDWFLANGVTAIALSVLHRNWQESTAWRRLRFADWREERRMDLKPKPRQVPPDPSVSVRITVDK